MNIFIICPVRGVDPKETELYVQYLEEDGHIVHWPPRDTNQDCPSGLKICRTNLSAIKLSDVVHFIWDGKSQGCLFDLGMAFALNKMVIPIHLPSRTDGKSFQNMVDEYYRTFGDKYAAHLPRPK